MCGYCSRKKPKFFQKQEKWTTQIQKAPFGNIGEWPEGIKGQINEKFD